jgi:outer membrane protein OmpA-like peptidoglycan-associated protein
MQKMPIIVLTSLTVVILSGCATKGYVRQSVSTSSSTLTARIEEDEAEAKEFRNGVDDKIAGVNSKVSTVDSRVTALDTKTAQGLASLKTDVQSADQRAGQANSAVARAATDIGSLDKKFQNRNQFEVANEKSVNFPVNSTKLGEYYITVLDEVAASLLQNPDAIVVLEGHTDSTGNKDANLRLAERRIDAVKRYLAINKHVPAYKIHDVSFGQDSPIAANNTRDGRQKNRAVNMKVLIPKSLGGGGSR